VLRKNSVRFFTCAADALRIQNEILVEHWDVIQDEATEEQSKNKAPMFGTSFPKYSVVE
jgi:predicted SnoaL-like aldol condensation-catalyzing enzyme